MKARRFDRGSQFAILACSQAIAEAGYDVARAPESVGIALGTGSAGAGALTEFLKVLFTESPEAAPPFQFPNTVAIASIAPDAQRQCPIIDLMEETGISRARDPSAILIAAVSAESFCGVAVPCALT